MLIRENKIYSQNGEDGVIASVFEAISTTNRFYVEIGCEDATECNTRWLSDTCGWTGVRFDNQNFDPEKGLYKYTVTPENVCDLLLQYDVPQAFDLLSVDVDFSDFHIICSILRRFQPRMVISDYNSSLGSERDCVVPYVRGQGWDGTNYFGASYSSFCSLADFFGYKVIYCESQGVNIFLVRQDIVSDMGIDVDIGSTFRPPAYNGGNGHPADLRGRRYLTSKHYLLGGTNTALTQFGPITYYKNDAYIGGVFSGGHYWKFETITEVSQRLLGAKGHVLDIGAHIGSHSIALAKNNPYLRFSCFEPQQSLYLLLERNIAENDLWERFDVSNVAVSSTNGELSLAATVQVEEAHERRVIEYGGSQPVNLGGVQLGVDGQPCRAIRIDDQTWPTVVYINVDVEGAGPLVFYGMQNLLRRDNPQILFEDRSDRRLDSLTLDSMGIEADVRNFSPRDFLESLGYQIGQLGLDYIGRPPVAEGPISSIDTGDEFIPAVIFQTWKSKTEFPANYVIWSRTFSTFNPSFRRVIWDDDDNYRFISERFPWFLDTFRNYPREIYRADAVRYFFLYFHGGIYADMDVECLRPLNDILKRGDVLVGRMGSDPHHAHSIPNAIMASKPRQEFWLLVIGLLIETAKQGGAPEYVTGPVALKSAVDLYLAKDPQWARSVIQSIARRIPPDMQPDPNMSDVIVLPPREWFAVDWTDPVHQILRHEVLHRGLLSDEQKKDLFPQSSMVTYWTHNW